MELFLNINNGIFIIKNAFPKELIEEMLNEIKSNIDKKDFKIRMSYSINDEKSVEIRSDYKDCNNEIFEIFNNINSTNVSSKYIEKKISNELDNKLLPFYRHALKFIYNQYEEFQFRHNQSDLFKYFPGSLMGKHTDSQFKTRLCTTLLYLNNMEDSFKGGEVLFYETDLYTDTTPIYKYTPSAGDLIIMDSSEKTNHKGIPHSVNKIENWDRYVNRTYWHNIN